VIHQHLGHHLPASATTPGVVHADASEGLARPV